jgi:hypothetical protein
MSDFRERYNHYMEMYKLSPPSVMDRRVSWAGGGPVLCNYDHHRRHRGGPVHYHFDQIHVLVNVEVFSHCLSVVNDRDPSMMQ